MCAVWASDHTNRNVTEDFMRTCITGCGNRTTRMLVSNRGTCDNLWCVDNNNKHLITIKRCMCHRCLYEPISWYWLGWRESPFSPFDRALDSSSNPDGSNTIFQNCIGICYIWNAKLKGTQIFSVRNLINLAINWRAV